MSLGAYMSNSSSIFYHSSKIIHSILFSGESSPHICKPSTLSVFAQTISFMKTRSGSPETVAFRGLKFDV